MKKIKFLNGISAVFALAVVALATTLTSCEKEEFNVNVTVTVKVPALQAGQFATLTPTIILQEEDAETKIVAVPTTSTDEKTKEKVWDNYELYWYSIPSFTYVEKSGAKVVEGSKKINTDDLIERVAIESFFNTLENTYTEHIE